MVSAANWNNANFQEAVSCFVMAIVAMQGALMSENSIMQKPVRGE